MHLESLFTFLASFPLIAMWLTGLAVLGSSLKQLISKEHQPAKQGRRFRFSARHAAMGMAFLPLSIIYRPSLLEVVKAEIRQQEDADEDDNGGADSPRKHLRRQLHRIRRGEQVDTLTVRLE